MIDAREAVMIHLDGPSLIVKRTGESTRRFPVRLLKQIVVAGKSLEGLSAVTECAAQQINVFFLSAKGDLRAQLFGTYTYATDWNEWLDQCRWNRSWTNTYESAVKQQWCHLLEESRLFKMHRSRCRKRYHEWVAATLRGRWGKSKYRSSWQWLQGFATILATNTIAETGIALGHSFRDRLLTDATQIVLFFALLDCYENADIQPPDGPKNAGIFYQTSVESWRTVLIRLFLLLEFRFTELENTIGFRHAS